MSGEESYRAPAGAARAGLATLPVVERFAAEELEVELALERGGAGALRAALADLGGVVDGRGRGR